MRKFSNLAFSKCSSLLLLFICYYIHISLRLTSQIADYIATTVAAKIFDLKKNFAIAEGINKTCTV